MSFCRILGKDKLIYVTKEDQEKPSTVKVSDLDPRYEEHGLVTPTGQLNWSCPCVGNMASGPCGFFFRQAFGCFHQSKADPKGTDCIDKFMSMQECFGKYPNLYQFNDKEDEMKEMNKELADKKD